MRTFIRTLPSVGPNPASPSQARLFDATPPAISTALPVARQALLGTIRRAVGPDYAHKLPYTYSIKETGMSNFSV
jgi:hypothetical protein